MRKNKIYWRCPRGEYIIGTVPRGEMLQQAVAGLEKRALNGGGAVDGKATTGSLNDRDKLLKTTTQMYIVRVQNLYFIINVIYRLHSFYHLRCLDDATAAVAFAYIRAKRDTIIR